MAVCYCSDMYPSKWWWLYMSIRPPCPDKVWRSLAECRC